jgi:hypothetical protein
MDVPVEVYEVENDVCAMESQHVKETDGDVTVTKIEKELKCKNVFYSTVMPNQNAWRGIWKVLSWKMRISRKCGYQCAQQKRCDGIASNLTTGI